jgi:hypothetical protein
MCFFNISKKNIYQGPAISVIIVSYILLLTLMAGP